MAEIQKYHKSNFDLVLKLLNDAKERTKLMGLLGWGQLGIVNKKGFTFSNVTRAHRGVLAEG